MREKILDILMDDSLSDNEKLDKVENLSTNEKEALCLFEIMKELSSVVMYKKIEIDIRNEAKSRKISYVTYLEYKIKKMKKICSSRKLCINLIYVVVFLNAFKLCFIGFNTEISKFLSIISLVLCAFSYYVINKNLEVNTALLIIFKNLMDAENY